MFLLLPRRPLINCFLISFTLLFYTELCLYSKKKQKKQNQKKKTEKMKNKFSLSRFHLLYVWKISLFSIFCCWDGMYISIRVCVVLVYMDVDAKKV